MAKRTSKFSPSLFISTFFYSGFISKKAPGTVGSILASLTCLSLFLTKSTQCFLVLAILSFTAGIISTHVFLFKKYGDTNRDPGYIVIDEVCGIFLGAFLLEYCRDLSVVSLIINLIFFRVFDIWKPFPISKIDTLFKKSEKTAALGVMLDDIVASIIGTSLQLLLF